MIAVKKRFGKEGGVVAYHGYQSFAPGRPRRKWRTRSACGWQKAMGRALSGACSYAFG
ncbi:MAG: hypothetical protein ACLRXC_11920 [[Clostridium] leptum]